MFSLSYFCLQGNEKSKEEKLSNVEELVQLLNVRDMNNTFENAWKDRQIDLLEILIQHSYTVNTPFPPKFWDGNLAFRTALVKFQSDLIVISLKYYYGLKIDIPPKDWNVNEYLKIALKDGRSTIVGILMKFSAPLKVEIPPKDFNANDTFINACNQTQ